MKKISSAVGPCVYSVYDKRRGITKFGMSRKLRNRVSQLKRDSPRGKFNGELINFVRFTDIDAAYSFEAHLVKDNVYQLERAFGREWFLTSGPVEIDISRLLLDFSEYVVPDEAERFHHPVLISKCLEARRGGLSHEQTIMLYAMTPVDKGIVDEWESLAISSDPVFMKHMAMYPTYYEDIAA